jgi:hypothetical protein
VVPSLSVALLAIHENPVTATDGLCTSEFNVFPFRAVVYFEERCRLQEYQHAKYHITFLSSVKFYYPGLGDLKSLVL